MTDELGTEQTAQRIAEAGRDALLEKLRPAFRQAARAHADVLELSDEQIEAMVQKAADRADGLQWRRALAGVASEQLGIGLGEALSHPAVARAQELLGAPSYEDTLAELAARRSGGAAETAAGETVEFPGPAEDAAEEEQEEEEEEAGEFVEDEEAPLQAEAAGPGPESGAPAVARPGAGRPGILRLSAVHLGGIANLERNEEDLELRLSGRGVEIIRGEGQVLGRISWREIRAVDVPSPRGMRRRRRRDSQLVVRTRQGEATFQIPALTPEELREHLTPVLDRHRRRH